MKSHRTALFIVAGLAILMWTLVSSSVAAVLEGRLATSFYSWQNTNGPGETVDHLQASQQLSLTAFNIGLPGISFHTHLRNTHDMLTGAERESYRRVSTLYARWHSKTFLRDLKVGRTIVPLGLRPSPMDGVQGTVSLGGQRLVSAYAGALVRAEDETAIAKWDREHVIGLNLTNIELMSTTLGFGYWRRTSEQPNPPAGREDLAEEFVSARAGKNLGKQLRFAGNLRYDLLYERVSRADAALRFLKSKKTFIETSCRYRLPIIDYNSYFSTFTQKQRTEIGAAVSHSFNKSTSLFVRYAVTLFHEDTAHRFSCRARMKSLEGAVGYRNGYGGDALSTSASYRFKLMKKLSLRTRAAYLKYNYADYNGSNNEVFTSAVVLSLSMLKGLAFDVEIPILRQNITNPSPEGYSGDERDVRLFARLTYLFGLGGTTGR
jgi:hypothetical protein